MFNIYYNFYCLSLRKASSTPLKYDKFDFIPYFGGNSGKIKP